MSVVYVDTKPRWDPGEEVFRFPVLRLLGDSVWVAPEGRSGAIHAGAVGALAIWPARATSTEEMNEFLEREDVTHWLEDIWNGICWSRGKMAAKLAHEIAQPGAATFARRALDNLKIGLSELPERWVIRSPGSFISERGAFWHLADWTEMARELDSLPRNVVWGTTNIYRDFALAWYRARLAKIQRTELDVRRATVSLHKEWEELGYFMRELFIEIGKP